MKLIAFLCVYNDPEYLDAAIESYKNFPDRLYLIEGAWESSLRFGVDPRSNELTESILRKHVDGERVVLVRANEATEVAQRQIGLELAKREGADWCMMLDADEVYTSPVLTVIRRILELALSHPEVFGFRMNSYNFINSFQKYYDGNYPRISRVTPGARFVYANDVAWLDHGKECWGPHIINMPKELRFFHYNYIKKDPEAFFLKMNFLGSENPTFNVSERQKYGFDAYGYRIPSDIQIKDFTGEHPEIIRNHPAMKHGLS